MKIVQNTNLHDCTYFFLFFSLIFSASATKTTNCTHKHYLCTVYWLLLSYRALKPKFQTKKLKSAIITSENPVMAPVPSVCVRVPHSPSLDSDKQSDSPGSPPAVRDKNKYHLDHTTEFATLAVRECVNQKYLEKSYFFYFKIFYYSYVIMFLSPHHCLPLALFKSYFKKHLHDNFVRYFSSKVDKRSNFVFNFNGFFKIFQIFMLFFYLSSHFCI